MQIDKSKFQPSTQYLLDLLESPEWPEAVAPFLICSETEEDKFERAEGILDYLNFDVKDKKVCDFGCGEGHFAIQASKKASLSVGYDIKQSGIHQWETNSPLLTTNLDVAIQNGPYDFVVLYDVLDHTNNPKEALKNVLKLCHPNTEIFTRCHSWMSRHGGHLYRTLNKAWVHLVFTEEEIRLMGIEPEYCYKYYLPLLTHKAWFESCNMKRVKEDVIKSVVEPFFKKPEIKCRLPLSEFKGEFPEWQMSQTFNDYHLSVKDAF